MSVEQEVAASATTASACCGDDCCGGTSPVSLGRGSRMTGRVLVLRAARASDEEAVRALLVTADLPAADMEAGRADGYVVGEAGGAVVAAAGVEVHGEHGLLRSVVVAREARGGGVGEAVVRDRIEWARERGLRSLYLLTTTAPDFFARLGFARVPRESAPEAVRASSEFASICPSTAVTMVLPLGAEALRATVREKYAAAAQRATVGAKSSCCGAGEGSCSSDPITSDLYDALETADLPSAAVLASLGCGNPTALAELHEGEVVLDLGSGGGIDVLLSAKRVGPTGKAYGLDMTDEMLSLARQNVERAGATNVEFLKGEIEAIPLPDASVDVIISNCVINLSADKGKVLREAFRVLRPGGRFAVSDIVVRGEVPAAVRGSMELWAGCVAGALADTEYRSLLADAGFVAIDVEPTRIYDARDAASFLEGTGLSADVAAAVDGRIMSAFVRARKPD
jgi:N-acetylglutamate synthase-like GNAT family acetyltransferase/2-polyprenyl-3-methyl-5-hydroxy-6-metoxy-1,4-benzoquinol methylase